MGSKEPQQEKTYISKLIPKDLLPLLLQQLWWKGFDEAQKKFPSEGTSNVAVDRLIKGMFIEFDEVAIRDQVEDLVANAMHRDWRGTMEEITLENKDWPTSKELRESLVDRILDVTLGRKQ